MPKHIAPKRADLLSSSKKKPWLSAKCVCLLRMVNWPKLLWDILKGVIIAFLTSMLSGDGA